MASESMTPFREPDRTASSCRRFRGGDRTGLSADILIE
jgi:hypothetical protein